MSVISILLFIKFPENFLFTEGTTLSGIVRDGYECFN